MEDDQREWLGRLRDVCGRVVADLEADRDSGIASGTAVLIRDARALHARLTRQLMEDNPSRSSS